MAKQAEIKRLVTSYSSDFCDEVIRRPHIFATH